MPGDRTAPGSQHSQEGFIPFLLRAIHKSRQLTQAPLLVRLDSAHDAIATVATLITVEVDFIARRNPRRADVPARASEIFTQGTIAQQGKKEPIALLTETFERTYTDENDGQKKIRVRRDEQRRRIKTVILDRSTLPGGLSVILIAWPYVSVVMLRIKPRPLPKPMFGRPMVELEPAPHGPEKTATEGSAAVARPKFGGRRKNGKISWIVKERLLLIGKPAPTADSGSPSPAKRP